MTENLTPILLAREANQPDDPARVLYGSVSAAYLVGDRRQDEAICRGLAAVPPRSGYLLLTYGPHYGGHVRLRACGRGLRVVAVDALAVCPSPAGRPHFRDAIRRLTYAVSRPRNGLFLTADVSCGGEEFAAEGWERRGRGGRYLLFLDGDQT